MSCSYDSIVKTKTNINFIVWWKQQPNVKLCLVKTLHNNMNIFNWLSNDNLWLTASFHIFIKNKHCGIGVFVTFAIGKFLFLIRNVLYSRNCDKILWNNVYWILRAMTHGVFCYYYCFFITRSFHAIYLVADVHYKFYKM